MHYGLQARIVQRKRLVVFVGFPYEQQGGRVDNPPGPTSFPPGWVGTLRRDTTPRSVHLLTRHNSQTHFAKRRRDVFSNMVLQTATAFDEVL